MLGILARLLKHECIVLPRPQPTQDVQDGSIVSIRILQDIVQRREVCILLRKHSVVGRKAHRGQAFDQMISPCG